MDVRTLCLGVLSLGDASGYEIKKRLESTFNHFYDASFVSIYPALNQLQKEGLVHCETEAQTNRPDKKVYNLTVDGQLKLVSELNNMLGRDRVRSDFLVAMLFSDLLPAGRIGEMIDRRLDELRKLVAELENREIKATPAQQFVAGYGRATYEAAAIYLKENRYLVESEALLAQVSSDRVEVPD